MVRPPSIDSNGMKKGAWSEDEDNKLRSYIQRYGHWNWRMLPKFAGLKRCGKSCRLRWVNYLKPGVKRGNFSKEEQELVIKLHEQLGNKWSAIAEKLPGRTDNEIKNFWHTRVKKRRKTNHQNHHRREIKKSANLTKADDHNNPLELTDSSEASSSLLTLSVCTPPSLSTTPQDLLEVLLSEMLEPDANETAAAFAPLLDGEFNYPELPYTVYGSFWNVCSNSESEASSYNYTTPVEEAGLPYNYDSLLDECFGYEMNLFC